MQNRNYSSETNLMILASSLVAVVIARIHTNQPLFPHFRVSYFVSPSCRMLCLSHHPMILNSQMLKFAGWDDSQWHTVCHFQRMILQVSFFREMFHHLILALLCFLVVK